MDRFYCVEMDLLGSILGNMAKPPAMSEKEKERRKKQREMEKKMEEQQKKATQVCREKAEKKISEFVKDEEATKLELPPMAKYERSVVHDVAEVAGLVAHSFGEEDVDRRVVIWKREHAPDEDELECYKRGLTKEEWEKTKAESYQKALDVELARKETKRKFTPAKGNYQQKYEHLIGKPQIYQLIDFSFFFNSF